MTQMSGADADALDHLGVQLERAGVRLRTTGQQLQRGLNSAPWTGRKADRFRQEFNSVHARAIADAAQFLDDAYATMIRNADQQRAASGSSRRSWFDRLRLELRRSTYWIERFPSFGWLPDLMPRPWPLPFPPLFPWPMPNWRLPWRPTFSVPDIRPIDPWDWLDDVVIGLVVGGGLSKLPWIEPKVSPSPVPKTPPPSTAAPAPSSDARAGETPGILRRSISDQRAQEIHDRFQPGLPRGYQYQCVSWAKARWIEQGVSPNAINAGDGWNLAANNGGRASNPPTLGAMASYGTADDWGHVMIVEEISTGPNGEMRIRVSEMNTGSDGSDANTGNPSEYQDGRVWTRQPDGTWIRDPQSNGPKRITFAPMP